MRSARLLLVAAVWLGAASASAAGFTSRFTLGTRFEATDGLSEFYGSFRRENPFPAYAPADGTPGSRLREAVVKLEGYQSLRSLYEPPAAPDLDGGRGYAYLVAEARYGWQNGWSLNGRLASRELSQDAWAAGTAQARARNTYWIDELYARYERWDDWRTLALGRERYTAVSGFVHDDYQPLARGMLDFGLAGGPPLYLRATASKIEGEHLDETHAAAWDAEGLFDGADGAFLGQATAGYPISLLESIDVSYLRFQERSGYFADLFNPFVQDVATQIAANYTARQALPAVVDKALEACRPAKGGAASPVCAARAIDAGLGKLAEAEYETLFVPLAEGAIGSGRSALNYVALEAEKYVGPVLLSGAAVGEWGHVTLTDIAPGVSRMLASPERLDFKTRGLLLYGSAEAEFSYVRLRAHYLFSSGDNRQFKSLADGDDYDSFLGVRPYIKLTNIFFAGGISENLRTGSISPSGYYGHGVWAPVADVEVTPLEPFTLAFTGAYLHAQRSPVSVDGLPERGGEYGWEADLMAFYRPLDWLRLSAEGDSFVPGPFFADLPKIWKAALGVDFVLDAPSASPIDH